MLDQTSTRREQGRITILVVDDTPGNLSVLGELLKPHYHVRVANSGARALAAVRTEPRPALILLDIMMPELDGYEVLRRLKSSPATSDIPVIFVTALNATEDESRGLALGAVDYITKPVRPAIVLARIRCQLELKEARDRLSDQNAWLEQEVARRMHQNQMVRDVSMRALASLAETRDEETGNHILCTQGYVNILSRQLARLPKYAALLTAETIDTYTKASPLHDIGKVGIPDSVLHKPGKLTAEEWEVMKTHAQIGADAIWRAIQNEEDMDGLDFLYVAMEIAAAHHEKWDGSGYPQGSQGEQIPLCARIMALADVFDALISRRVYKEAFAFDAACDIIREGSGTHFDPDIVQAFNDSIDAFQAIAMRHKDVNVP